MNAFKKIFFLFLIFICNNSFGQKTAKQNIREGDLYFYSNDYAGARRYYSAAWKMDSSEENLAFKLGASMYNLKKYKPEALRYFEKADKEKEPETKFYLGNLYHLNGKFQDAISMFADYLNEKKKKIPDAEIKTLIEKSKTAMEMTAHPVNVKIENMGSE